MTEPVLIRKNMYVGLVYTLIALGGGGALFCMGILEGHLPFIMLGGLLLSVLWFSVDMLGYITLDEEGIHRSLFWYSRTVSWSDVSELYIRKFDRAPRSPPSITIKLRGKTRPIIMHLYIESEARAVQEALTEWLPKSVEGYERVQYMHHVWRDK